MACKSLTTLSYFMGKMFSSSYLSALVTRDLILQGAFGVLFTVFDLDFTTEIDSGSDLSLSMHSILY